MKNFLLTLSVIFCGPIFAEDTTWVKVHDSVDMTYYGHYKKWGEFPPSENEYRKVIMYYTMGCASTGCSGWDYDTHVLLRNRTKDSTNIAPNYIWNQDGFWSGEIPDSVSYSANPTYYISTDTIQLTYDTVWNSYNEIVFLGDSTSLFNHVDTIHAYPTNYSDSFITLNQIPYDFTVNSSYQDYIAYSFDTTYQYIYIDSTNMVEITINDPIEILIYNSICEISDTLLVWEIQQNTLIQTDSFDLKPNLFYDFEFSYDSLGVINDTISATSYHNQTYNFDSAGNIIDTVYFYADTIIYNQINSCGWLTEINTFSADSTIYLNYTIADNYYVWKKIEEFELGRNITPYGTYMQGNGSNGYSPDWTHQYTYDVTDFQHLLVDSVEIDAFYSGWSSGFSVTLDFEFIEGTPPRNTIDVKNIYYNKSASGHFASSDYITTEAGLTSKNYNNSTDFETNQMPAKVVNTLENAKTFRLQFVPSGHGQSGEFTPGIHYYANVNGNLAGSNEIWKDDCGFNAIYPQGGTWIFDRANWCPGEAVPIFNHEITPYITPGDSATINIDFTAYNPSSGASYSCATQFFQYDEANFSLDAEIIDIITPSLKDEHSRLNPYQGNPVIKIRNSGSTPLTSLIINYKMEGGSTNSYEWSGNLSFLEEEEVTMESFNWDGNENVFEVQLESPNGSTDEHPENNIMKTAFEDVPVYPNSFVVVFRTNNHANENSWQINDQNGNIIYERNDLPNSTLIKDTVYLLPGSYHFTFNDIYAGNNCTANTPKGKDGLSFWYWNTVPDGWVSQLCPDGGGSSFISLRNLNTSTLKAFNKDFGSKISHWFRVEENTSLIEHDGDNFCYIYPNPTQGEISINWKTTSNINLEVSNLMGEILLQAILPAKQTTKTIDLSGFSNGVYLIHTKTKNKKQTQKIILNR